MREVKKRRTFSIASSQGNSPSDDLEATWRFLSIHLHLQSYLIMGIEASSSEKSEEQTPASTEYLVHNWLEALFTWFQMIILWHDPLASIGAISGLLTSFLLLTYFAPRFYAIIMIAIFVYNLIIVWFKHIWPEIRVPQDAEQEEQSRLDVDRWTLLHPQVITLNEFRQMINNLMKICESYLEKLLTLRCEKPIHFCLLVCSCLSCTAFIGNKLSGQILIFSILTILSVLAPVVYLYRGTKMIQEIEAQGLKETDEAATPAANVDEVHVDDDDDFVML